MKRIWIAASATALAALFLVAVNVEQAAAQRGGGHGGGGGGGGGPSAGRGGGGGGAHFSAPGRSSGGSARSSSRSSPRVYGYARRGDGRGHVRRFHGGRAIYGVPLYGAYAYGSCDYYYQRAMATGSPYWWDRYEACTGDY